MFEILQERFLKIIFDRKNINNKDSDKIKIVLFLIVSVFYQIFHNFPESNVTKLSFITMRPKLLI